MNDEKPEVRDDSSTITLTVTGPFNWSPSVEPASLGAYSSNSYTMGAVIEAADSEPQGATSKPPNAATVKALDSVFHSRASGAGILRDESGEL
jgi:hypothetical protein